jgi:Family of unknown function (DUF6278)
VFSSPTSDRSRVVDGPLLDTDRLRQWSRAHGVVLADDDSSLGTLDVNLDKWSADPSHYEHVDLGNEVGVYLGNIIARTIPGAHWRVWPNGHPVIALASKSELDVIALVGDRILNAGPSLQSIYSRARSQ